MTFSRTASGLYVPRALGGAPPGAMPLPPDAGASNNPADQAKGFVASAVANEARSRFMGQGFDPAWVPTQAGQIGPWAREQAQIFTSPSLSQGIDAGKFVYEKYMGIPSSDMSPFFPPFTEDQAGQWAESYVAAHGFPTDAHSGLAMARAFVLANADQIGLPPEFMVGKGLVEKFPPSTVEDAAAWTAQLGGAFLTNFGVPLVDVYDTSSFFAASARIAVAQMAPGVPFSFFEATFDALSDGQVTPAEAKGIIVGAAGYVGAVVGQAFGIPAPIGAFIAQLLVGGLVDVLSDAFGWGQTDSEKLLSAQHAAQDAAAAASAKCTALATALWLEYQHYWDAITRDLDGSIRANQEWLTPKGSCGQSDGIRLFGAFSLDTVRDKSGNPIILNAAQVKKGQKPVYRVYPYQVSRSCDNPQGCSYLSYGIGSIVTRDQYALSPGELNRVPSIRLNPPGCDATTALAFWGAQRFVTPEHVYHAMKGKSLEWVDPPSGKPVVQYQEVVHSDYDYLSMKVGNVGTVGKAGTDVGQCNVGPWASFMFRSLEQAAAAATLVQRDLARTVSAAATAYGIQYHLDRQAGMKFQSASDAQKRAAVRKIAAQAAAFRHAVMDARRSGKRKADLINYGLLTAGGAALLGYTLGKR